MRPTEIYKHFTKFEHASACAKEAARILGTVTEVKWHLSVWIVLVPTGALSQLNASAEPSPQADSNAVLAQACDYDEIGPEEASSADTASFQTIGRVIKKKDGMMLMAIRHARLDRRRLRTLHRSACTLAQQGRRPLIF